MHQTRLLARAFFDRLFESDLMPEGWPQVQLVLWSVLLAATPTTAMPLVFLKKYAHDQFYMSLAPEMAADRMILLTLSMMAIGVVGLFIWDGVFPDRRDVRILGPLPIRTRRFIVARLAALGRVYVMFTTAICVSQSVIFGLVVAGYGDPVSRVHGIAAHLVTVFLACTFIFCGFIAAQCLLLLMFGRRVALTASLIFQLLFAIALVQLVFFLPDLGRVIREGSVGGELTSIAALPPTWFFGLYEVLSGTGDSGSITLAQMAVGSTLLSVVLAVGLYAASYDLLSRRALEGPAPRSGRARESAIDSLPHLALTGRTPLTSAVREFTVKTLIRSRSHRMMLAIYAGVALAFVISSGVSIVFGDEGTGIRKPGLAMLSMPLIVQFIMLIAIRVITSVPSEPKARWVFRACEPVERIAAINGLRATMMNVVVLPTVVFAFAQGIIFWTAIAAVSHAAFCFVVGRLLTEVLLLNLDKLPFACTYFPGKSRVFALWPLYLTAFFAFTIGFGELDRVMLSRHRALVIWCLLTTLAVTALASWRRRTLDALPALRFEEEDPDRLFQGFNLSEGIAAETKRQIKYQHPTSNAQGESLETAGLGDCGQA